MSEHARLRDELLEAAKRTSDQDARRAMQRQAEIEAVLAGERRPIYVEPWRSPLYVRVTPSDDFVTAALSGVPELVLTDTDPQVTLERHGELWYLTDAVADAHPDRALLVMTEVQVRESIRKVMAHYFRLAIPLRLAETAQLRGVLEVTATDASDAVRVADAHGVYDVAEDGTLSLGVRNRSDDVLRIFLLNVAGSGKCQTLGDAVLAPDEHYASNDGVPWHVHAGAGRRYAIDRFVVVGTTDVDRDLTALEQDKSFRDVLMSSSRGPSTARAEPSLEKWAATTLVLRVTKPE